MSEAQLDWSDRRAHRRFKPKHQFEISLRRIPGGGLMAMTVCDVSEGGARLEAPPRTRPEAFWGDAVELLSRSSDGNRTANVHLIHLRGRVVETRSSEQGLAIRIQFEDVDQTSSARLIEYLKLLEQIRGG